MNIKEQFKIYNWFEVDSDYNLEFVKDFEFDEQLTAIKIIDTNSSSNSHSINDVECILISDKTIFERGTFDKQLITFWEEKDEFLTPLSLTTFLELENRFKRDDFEEISELLRLFLKFHKKNI